MDLFQWLTDTTEGKCLFTTLVSMIPIIELRGGIPFGVALGLPYWLAFPAAVIGNVIPAPFMYRVHPPHLRLDAQTSAPPEQHGGQAGGEGPPEGTEGAALPVSGPLDLCGNSPARNRRMDRLSGGRLSEHAAETGPAPLWCWG